MKAATRTVADVLNGLDRATLLGLISYVQRRMNRDAVLLRLLQDRLAQLTSPPASKNEDNDQLLTVKEVARMLKVNVPRAHELIRQKRLPSIILGERQIRVRRRDLDESLQPRTP